MFKEYSIAGTQEHLVPCVRRSLPPRLGAMLYKQKRPIVIDAEAWSGFPAHLELLGQQMIVKVL